MERRSRHVLNTPEAVQSPVYGVRETTVVNSPRWCGNVAPSDGTINWNQIVVMRWTCFWRTCKRFLLFCQMRTKRIQDLFGPQSENNQQLTFARHVYACLAWLMLTCLRKQSFRPDRTCVFQFFFGGIRLTTQLLAPAGLSVKSVCVCARHTQCICSVLLLLYKRKGSERRWLDGGGGGIAGKSERVRVDNGWS